MAKHGIISLHISVIYTEPKISVKRMDLLGLRWGTLGMQGQNLRRLIHLVHCHVSSLERSDGPAVHCRLWSVHHYGMAVVIYFPTQGAPSDRVDAWRVPMEYESAGVRLGRSGLWSCATRRSWRLIGERRNVIWEVCSDRWLGRCGWTCPSVLGDEPTNQFRFSRINMFWFIYFVSMLLGLYQK